MFDAEYPLASFILKLLSTLVAWFLVVLGWAAVSELDTQRERRLGETVNINRLRTLLDEIEQLALRFHSMDFDEALARSISRKLKSFGMECSHLERCEVIDDAWRIPHNNVKRSVTLENFEKGTHLVRALNDDLLVDIEQSVSKLNSILLRGLETKLTADVPFRETLRKVLRKI